MYFPFPLVVCGLRNNRAFDTPDAFLVVNKDKVQDIKRILADIADVLGKVYMRDLFGKN